jgi:hypothetical protein
MFKTLPTKTLKNVFQLMDPKVPNNNKLAMSNWTIFFIKLSEHLESATKKIAMWSGGCELSRMKVIDTLW